MVFCFRLPHPLLGLWNKKEGSLALVSSGQLFQAAEGLERIGIAFLELREPGPEGTFGRSDQPRQSPIIRRHFSGPLVLNSDYSLESAQADLAAGKADAISFGRPFISNPDLPVRLQSGAELAQANMKTWYSQGLEGYIDYPPLSAEFT